MKTCRRLSTRSLHTPLVLFALIPALLLVAVSCRKPIEAKPVAAPAAAAVPLTERIGWFQGPCLAISNQHLARGTSVTLVVMGDPQKIQQARTLEPTTDPATCKALLQDRAKMNAKPGTSFYALETASVGAADMGIGIIQPPAGLAVVNGLARVDLDSDGQSEVFSSCATSEGIKFAVWTGKPYQGEPRWSAYYYLGYDLQPTCP